MSSLGPRNAASCCFFVIPTMLWGPRPHVRCCRSSAKALALGSHERPLPGPVWGSSHEHPTLGGLVASLGKTARCTGPCPFSSGCDFDVCLEVCVSTQHSGERPGPPRPHHYHANSVTTHCRLASCVPTDIQRKL